MNNKKIQVWLPLFFSFTMIVGLYFGYYMRDNMPGKPFFFRQEQRPLQEIIDLINNKYVDEVKTDALADTAIKAILSKLDPHSVFIPAQQVQLLNDDLAGKFFGIGIEFNIFNDTLNVINVINGGPGDKAGMQTGDKFIFVNDSSVAGKKMNPDQYRTLLRGERRTSVDITFLRDRIQKKVTLTRDAIPVSSVDAVYMLGSVTGYIRLNKFSTQTYHEFMEALDSLKKQGLQKLVLDLRGNGGGILEEAVEIADEFLDGDKLITYTEGKHAPRKEYRCRREGGFEKGPLVVLADEGTASASEVLIGALQDWDRAIVIGRRTFGKGLVQEQFDLSDKSALRLTIARYYTPVGRSIQRPYASGDKAYYEEITKRYHDGETQTQDSVKNDTSRIYLSKSGKKLYGGGGITPDQFIALDTLTFNEHQVRLSEKGTLVGFAYNYYLLNRKMLSGFFKTPADFYAGFLFTDEDWQKFIAVAAKDSIDLKGIPKDEKNILTSHIKANLARMIWRNEGFFEVLNRTDESIKRATFLLQK